MVSNSYRLYYLFQHVRKQLESDKNATDHILWDVGLKAPKEMIKWCQDQWRRKRPSIIKNKEKGQFPSMWCQNPTDLAPVCPSCGATCPECREELGKKTQESEEAILNMGKNNIQEQRRVKRKGNKDEVSFTESVADRIVVPRRDLVVIRLVFIEIEVPGGTTSAS